MPLLHNRVNGKILKQRIQEDPTPRTTLSFYQYAHIPNPQQFRDELYQLFNHLHVLGRIYLAHEGINAQLSLPTDHLQQFIDSLYRIPFLNGVRLNYAIEDDGKSFFKLTVKVRHKIVADGLNDATFDVTNKGTHLNAKDFNQITDNPDTIVVDMRNHYESEVGHFTGAICPDVDTFREALPVVANILKGNEDKPIVMYCTGGIRCEKASAYFKHIGFKNVYQLEGGIIEYARQAKQQGLPNKFVGTNFVFDSRMGEHISTDIISKCHQCGKPADTHVNCANDGCHLLFIQCAECAQQYEGCCSTICMQTIHLPPTEQKHKRKGLYKGLQVFKKGRESVYLSAINA